ncbi:MAG: response regulator [Anaerolineales bacterium]
MSEEKKTLVLIVDDILETRENIGKLLQFEPDIEVVGGAGTGKEAVAMAKKLRPNVIMMDINMPDMDGIAATEQIMRVLPSAQVIMLSVQNDPDYMRRAMMAGARDFLAKPPAGDELIATIRRVAEMSRARQEIYGTVPIDGAPGTGPMGHGGRNGKIIAVYSPKGGAGCTTIATNLGVTLQNDKTRVMLVDADLQFGDVAVFLNLQNKHSVVELADSYDDLEPEFVATVTAEHSSGMKVLLAPFTPEEAEVVSGAAMKAILDHLRNFNDYVVVDMGTALNDVALSIFDAADAILLLAAPDIPSIKDARLFFDIVDALDYSSDRVFLVLNKVSKKGGIAAADIAASIKHSIVIEIPDEPRMILHSINRGMPIVLYDKPTPPARAIQELTRKLVDVFAQAED